MKSIQILNEIDIPTSDFNNQIHIEWVQSNIHLIDTIIEEIETLEPKFNEEIEEIPEKAIIEFIVSINFKELAIKRLNIIFRESRLSNKARSIHIKQLKKVKKLYIEVIEFLEGKKKVINNPESIPIPNHIMKAMTKQQKGIIGDIKEKTDREKFINTLENTIKKDYKELPDIAEKEISKINNDYEISKYLGFKINIHEIMIVRAILVIVSKMVELGKIKDTDKMIYILWKDIYEECGIPKAVKGGHEPKLAKPIKELILKNEEGNLTKQQWLKDDFSGRIIRSQFLLEVEPKGRKVGLHLSSWLFYDKKKLAKCTMMDNKGFVRFRKENRSEIGINLFLFLERYMSQKDEEKTLDLNTIIRIFNLNALYEKNKKRTIKEIEKAFNDMVAQRTVLKDWQQQKGVNEQLQYKFVNLNYKQKEIQQQEQVDIGKIVNIAAKKAVKKINKTKIY